ncbi:MAG TPA: hypothetical protein PK752_17605 [Accumulibacter sp.]|uniref:hypothetical protein n=1 Tax=Accumulibacter sp. TaxID=2053492 RepID=UPI002CEB0A71|nr:hypothetical protein [Accumulibacter sp.]HRD90054.1 hypothetical protein [Accumulibacter sp.]
MFGAVRRPAGRRLLAGFAALALPAERAAVLAPTGGRHSPLAAPFRRPFGLQSVLVVRVCDRVNLTLLTAVADG